MIEIIKKLDDSTKNVGVELLLQNAVTTTGNGVIQYMDGADTFKITEISGNAASFTVVFEVSNSATGTFTAVQGVRLSDYTMASTTSNFGEVWQIDGLSGLYFRVRVSAIAGGNLNVKGKVIG